MGLGSQFNHKHNILCPTTDKALAIDMKDISLENSGNHFV